MTQAGTKSDWEEFIAMLNPKGGDRILDIGAGKGEKAAKVLRTSQGIEVYAVDPNERRIAEAKRDHPDVKSFVAGAEKLPFDEAYFDKAYSTMALHHFNNLDLAFAETTRVLKHGGTYVVLEVEPGSMMGRLFRFFGRIMGEGMNIMTETQCLARLRTAGGLQVVTSTSLGPRYLVLLRRR